MENSNIRMEKHTKASGRMESRMVQESLFYPMGRKWKDDGKRAN